MNCFVDVQRGFVRGRFLRQGANPRDYFARPHAVADNSIDNFEGLIKIWRLPRKQAHTRMAVGDYGAEWLINFMSYRGYKFSHGHHSRDVRQLRLCLVQPIVGFLALGDVHNAHQPQSLILPIRVSSARGWSKRVRQIQTAILNRTDAYHHLIQRPLGSTARFPCLGELIYIVLELRPVCRRQRR